MVGEEWLSHTGQGTRVLDSDRQVAKLVLFSLRSHGGPFAEFVLGTTTRAYGQLDSVPVMSS